MMQIQLSPARGEPSRECDASRLVKRKLVILNNGLRDHRGHYFETSVAIADAAIEAGLHPVLATHVDCPRGLFPDWLEVYPLCTTDHWMSEPAAQPPNLCGVRTDPYPHPPVTPDAVRQRQQSVRDYIVNRFERFAIPSLPAMPPAPPPPDWRQQLAIVGKWCARACRGSLWVANRLSYYCLPPFLDRFLRLVAGVVPECMPRALKREFREHLRRKAMTWVRLLTGWPATACEAGANARSHGPFITAALSHRVEGPFVAHALARLQPEDLEWELENALIFKRDLESLAALAGLGPHDHVLLGTAHGRELLAVRMFVERMGPARSPTFHLEFRHPLFAGTPSEDQLHNSPSIRRQQAFFGLYHSWGVQERIRFYTDTDELSSEYSLVAGLDFASLPIPFRTQLVAGARQTEAGPLVLAFLGDARDEKGFHWLPELIDLLYESHVRNGKVRFVLQATLGSAKHNPLSVAALERLRRYPPQEVDLVGKHGPLLPHEYYQLVSQADIVLLPYERDRYRAASSGTLTEALAAGIPSIVPAQSWMSAQLPPGAGEVFIDERSFQVAVKKVVDGYGKYRRRAEAFRHTWLAKHTPGALVNTILAQCQDGAGHSAAA